MDSRQARKMMKRMGMTFDEIEDVQQVIIKTTQKELVIENPSVTHMSMRGESIFQISGGNISEKTHVEEEIIPEEDVQLVMDRTGNSWEEAKEALVETKGDLASAILLLQSRS